MLWVFTSEKPMPAQITSRERVECAIRRTPHDRVPRFDTFWDDTLKRWQAEGLSGGEDAAHACLQADMIRLTPFIWPAPFPGRQEVLSRAGNTVLMRDEWGGIVRLFDDHQTTPEHISWECDSPDKWQAAFKDAIAASRADRDMQDLGTRQAKADERHLWGYIPTVEPFECLRKLIGDVEFMMSMIEEPEWIREMAQVTTSRTLQELERLLAQGIRPDGLWIYGDMAYNHSTFCSPRQYRELIWPQHKRMCDWAHSRGLKTIYHTDGNATSVLDLLIEAGVDVFQPLECKANMQIADLAPKYGDRLTFFGNIDVMVMISGDEAAIEKEIAETFAAGMATNGYIYHSDHSVPPQVSWPLYQKIVGFINKYGNY